jgi:hypothetical protein
MYEKNTTSKNHLNELKSFKYDYINTDGTIQKNYTYYYFGNDGIGETAPTGIIPVPDDRQEYSIHFDVNYFVSTSNSTDASPNGTMIQAKGTATLPPITMEKGKSYVYIIAINAADITPNDDNQTLEPIKFTATAEEWKDSDEYEDWIHTPVGNVTDKNDVQLYDYAMKDGSFVHLGEGETLTTVQKDECLGIVCWLNNDESSLTLEDDPLLKEMGYTNGLIVSLNYFWSSWQNSSYSVYDNYQCSSDEYSTYPAITATDKLNGYSNTQIYREFNATEPGDDYIVNPVATLDAKGYSVIANTSGWYIPSYKELELIMKGEGNNSGEDLVAAKFNKLFNINDFYAKGTTLYGSNFSSTEEDNSIQYGYYYATTTSNNVTTYKCYNQNLTKSESNHVRAICAF